MCTDFWSTAVAAASTELNCFQLVSTRIDMIGKEIFLPRFFFPGKFFFLENFYVDPALAATHQFIPTVGRFFLLGNFFSWNFFLLKFLCGSGISRSSSTYTIGKIGHTLRNLVHTYVSDSMSTFFLDTYLRGKTGTEG